MCNITLLIEKSGNREKRNIDIRERERKMNA